MTKKLIRYLALAIAIFMLAVACSSDTKLITTQVKKNSQSTEANILKIWWDKGYIAKEDEILQQIVSSWQQLSGEKAEIKFYNADEIAQKTRRAIQAGFPPDILFSSRAEYPLLAWQGKLADVSDVIKPVEQLYTETARKAAFLYSNKEKKRSYYGVPLHQGTIHIFYWKDLLNKVDKDANDIPHNWDEFWEFWKTVQKQLSKQQEIYGLGIPFSVEASDTYYLFEQILEAYSVEILDPQGRLQVDDFKVRQGIINCLKWYADLYQQGYVPPNALKWLDPDNNRDFLNRQVIMTPNPTLSIATALLENKKAYLNELGTMEFPNKPDGSSMRHLVAIRQAAILAGAKNQKKAKDFLAYLIQPEVIGNYLKSAGGRYLPVLTVAKQDSYWKNPENPHVSTATKTLTQGKTKLFYSALNPVYSSVLEKNIWGKALNRIAVDKISPEQAGDEAISQIKEIFAAWK